MLVFPSLPSPKPEDYVPSRKIGKENVNNKVIQTLFNCLRSVTLTVFYWSGVPLFYLPGMACALEKTTTTTTTKLTIICLCIKLTVKRTVSIFIKTVLFEIWDGRNTALLKLGTH